MDFFLLYLAIGLIFTAVIVTYNELTDPEARQLREEIIAEHGLFGVFMFVIVGLAIACVWPYLAFTYGRLVVRHLKKPK